MAGARTRKDVRELAMDIAGVADNRAIQGFNPVRFIDAFCCKAHELVQMELYRLEPTIFVRHDRFTYEANSMSVSFETKLDTAQYGRVHKIITLGYLMKNEDVSKDNLPTLMNPFSTGTRSAVSPIVTVGTDVLAGGAPTTMSGFTMNLYGQRTYEWRMQNNDCYIAPIPVQDLYIFAEWVPIQPFDADDALTLGGFVPQAEMLVVYKTAELFGKAKGFLEAAARAQVLYDEEMAQMPNKIQRRPVDMGYINFRHPDARVARRYW